MTDLELEALIALVRRCTATIEHDTQRYGQIMSDPDAAAAGALRMELERRGVLQQPSPPASAESSVW